MEESKKRLLLNKQSLGVVAFAAKERGRYNLNVLHVEKDYVEATTGSILVRLSHPKADSNEFPVTPGEPFDEINFELPLDSIREIKIPTKIYLPILSNACLSKEGEMINVSTTNLDVMQSTKIKPVDGEFPDTEQFFDNSIDSEVDGEWTMFTLNSDIIKTLADYVSRQSGRPNIPITFWVKEPDAPIHFRFKFSDTEQEGRGVMMPMIGSDVKKGLIL